MKRTYLTSRENIFSIEVPEATASYTPISNELLINTCLEAFDKQEFQVAKEEHRISYNNSVFVSLFTFQHSEFKDLGLMFGVLNSYDKSKRASYALGGHVFVCQNGMINGEEVFLRKHTGFADVLMKLSIEDGVKKMSDNYLSLRKDIDSMKGIDVNKRNYAQILGDMYLNKNILNSEQLSVVKNQMYNPKFEYGVENTLYNLYQDITYSFKSTNPKNYIDSHVNLHKYIKEEFLV